MISDSQLLAPNEKVIWSGYPKKNFAVTFLDVFYFIFGGAWTWNLLVTTNITSSRKNVLELCFLTIFLLFGLFAMFGNVLIRYFFRKRIEYVITDKRIIVINKSNNSVLIESAVESLKHISKKVGSQGIGTIEFGIKPYAQQMYGETLVYTTPFSKRHFKKWWEWNTYFWGNDKWIPVFYDILDVESVYKLVTDLRKTNLAIK